MSTVKIAAATSDSKYIDLHFGQAETLTVYTLSNTGEVLGTEQRPGLGSCVCRDDSGHDEEAMRIVLKSLCDCKYLLVKRIGQHMVRELAANGIVSFELFGDITPALEKIIQYEHKQQERVAARQSAAQ
jgi:predicted Fe-Mo cluster-binding NifX family protein